MAGQGTTAVEGQVMIEASGITKVYGVSKKRVLPLLRQDRRREAVRDAGGTLAADGVTFTVARGELFVLMGLSGSGKSTVLRMLNRLVEPTAGQLRVAGQDLVGMAPDELRALRNTRMSMVFQHFALLPHRTVLENTAFGLKVRGMPAKARLEHAHSALRRVGLGDRGGAYPSELSGGMKQRVGLARALATDAEILLMDEPFSALDPLIRRDMQELLLQLQRQDRRTIVFVTHDLNEAMRIGHRIMVMNDGQVVQCGTRTEIISSPADEYVSDFVADVDRSRFLTASSVLRPPLLTATADERPDDVLRRLENAEANGVFVLDGRGRILGVAQDDLLAQAVRNGDTDLNNCLTGGYDAVPPDLPLVEFCHLAGQRSVPVAVVDNDQRLLGVAPRAAILSALASPKVTHA